MKPDETAFEGSTIRLRKKDYDMWHNCYCPHLAEADYLRELTGLDVWVTNLPENKRKSWFFMIGSILGNKYKAESWKHYNG